MWGCACLVALCLFFFNDTATTEIYTLSLHDALPIIPSGRISRISPISPRSPPRPPPNPPNPPRGDRKSTRLNSSHTVNSYAVFCLKKKKKNKKKTYGQKKRNKNRDI